MYSVGVGETVRRLPTLLVMLILLTSTLPIMSINASANSTTISTFTGGFATVNVELQGGVSNSTTTIDVPRNVTFTSASLDIEIDASDASPGQVWLDLEEDGVNEWQFSGTGYGDLGHQSVFYDDSSYTVISAPGGPVTAPGFYVPSESDLKSSQIDATFSSSLGGGFFPIGEYSDAIKTDLDGDQFSEPVFLSTINSTTVGTAIAYADWTSITGTTISSWIPTCLNATSLDVGDVNGDGSEDIVTFSPSDGLACIHISNSTQSTGFDPVINSSLSSGLIEGNVGDVDGNGNADVISIHAMGIISYSAWDNSTANLTVAITETVNPNGSMGIPANLLALEVEDFFSSNNESILVQDQDGHWSNWDIMMGSWAGPITSFDHIKQNPMVIDLDGDGDLDFFGKNDVGYSFLINDGANWSANITSGQIELTNSTIADYDGDGALDLLCPIPGESDGSSSTLEGNISHRTINSSALGTTSPMSLEPWSMPQHIITMDMDGDGVLEQVVMAGELTKGVFISAWNSISLDANGDGNVEIEHSGYAGDGSNGLDGLTIMDDNNAISTQINPVLLTLPRLSNMYGVDVANITIELSSNSAGSFNLTNLDIGYDAEFRIDINPHATMNLTNVFNQQMTAGVGTFSIDLPFNSTNAGKITLTNLVAIHTPGAPTITLPPTPTLKLVSAGELGVTIAWDEMTTFGEDLVRFEIFRLNASNETVDVSNPYSTSMANFSTDSNTNVGMTYWYLVRSVHVFGVTSNLSNILEVTVPYPMPPGEVEGISVTDVDADTGGALEVTWNASTDSLDHYAIYVETSNFTNISGLTSAITVANGTTSVMVSGLEDGTAYWVSVVAVDQFGNSSLEVVAVGPTYPRNDVPTPVNIELTVSEYISVGQPFVLSTSATLGGVSATPTGIITVTLSSSQGSHVLANDWNGLNHSDFLDLGSFAQSMYGEIVIYANYSGDIGDEQIRPIASASTSVSRIVSIPANLSASADTYVLDWENETVIMVELSAQYQAHQSLLENYPITWTAFNSSSNISVSGATTVTNGASQFLVNLPGGDGDLYINLTGENWLDATPEFLLIDLVPFGVEIEDNTTDDNSTDNTWSPSVLQTLVIECPSFTVDESISGQTTMCTFTNPNNFTVSVELDQDGWSDLSEQIGFFAAIGQNQFTLDASETKNITIEIDVIVSLADNGIPGGVMTVKGLYEVEDSINLNFIGSKSISQSASWNLAITIPIDEPDNNDGETNQSTNAESNSEESQTLLYVLSGFGFAVLCLIVFIIIRVRENIEWERDDDEDYDEDEGLDLDRTSKPLPVGMALDLIEDKRIVDATPEGLESELMKEIDGEYEVEDNSVEYEEESNDDSGISVDDDGTEWYEDEVGVWWYRDQDMEDWAEWTE